MQVKKRNFKLCLCLFSIISILIAQTAVASDNYNEKYISKIIKEQNTKIENISDETFFNLEQYLYENQRIGNFEEAKSTLEYIYKLEKEYPNEDRGRRTDILLVELGLAEGTPDIVESTLKNLSKNKTKETENLINRYYSSYYNMLRQPNLALEYLTNVKDKQFIEKDLEISSIYSCKNDIANAQKYIEKYKEEAIKTDKYDINAKINYYTLLARIYLNANKLDKFKKTIYEVEKYITKEREIELELLKFEYYKKTVQLDKTITLLNRIEKQISEDDFFYYKQFLLNCYLDYYTDKDDISNFNKIMSKLEKEYKNVQQNPFRMITFDLNSRAAFFYMEFNTQKEIKEYINKLTNTIGKYEKNDDNKDKNVLLGDYKLILAIDALKSKDYTLTKKYLDESYNYYKSVFNVDTREFINLYERYAHYYNGIGDKKNTEKYYKKALKLSEKVEGPTSMSSLELYSNVANFYYWIQEYDKALELYDKGYNNAVIILGEINPKTIEYKVKKYQYYRGTKNTIEGDKQLEEITEIVLGNKDVETTPRLLYNIYIHNCYSNMDKGKTKEAIKYAKKAAKVVINAEDKNNAYKTLVKLYKDSGKDLLAKYYQNKITKY